MRKLITLLLLLMLFSTLYVVACAENFDYYFSATFSASPKFYTGPGTNYYRVGKAQYGGGGQARVYGYDGNWLLLGYETAKGNYRIGYFEKSYLSKMKTSASYNLRKMNFEYRDIKITSGCDITDDPILLNEPFGWLSSGTRCSYLANYGSNWAYIQVYVNGKTVRGFVPMNCIDTQPNPNPNPNPGPQPIYANLLMRLSTRSGPSTNYDEPGTFFQNTWQSTTVKVLGKAWDSRNDIWWVLVDFSENGTRYRAWTGLKRVNVNIDRVPEIRSIGRGSISATDTRRGPGGNYAKGPRVNSWMDVVVYGRENGYVEVEYYSNGRYYRCWVPESKAQIWYY